MLHAIELSRYRNIDDLRVEFCPGVNALIGSNGQGKTNILEAVYYLSLLRSFRTGQINDLKQWKAPVFRLHAVCSRPGMPSVELDVVHGSERRLLINGNPVYRTSDFINQFICITFIPQDMELIRGPETVRRRFMDIAVTQVSPPYLRNLQAYNEALKSRNALLKALDKYDKAVVTAYDAVLVRAGVQVELARRQFIQHVNEALDRDSEALVEDGRRLSLKYLSGIGMLLQANDDGKDALEQRFLENLDRNYERDCREGFTHIGPHRAEMACLLDRTSLLHYGSEGECRMASLAVKFACMDMVRKALGTTADITLLVDDVIGELDERRQRNFFGKLMQSGQILLAGTFLPDCLKQNARVLHIQGGQIS